MVETITSMFTKTKKNEQHEIAKRLREMGRSSEAANIILAIMVGSTVELSLGEQLSDPSICCSSNRIQD
jgi:linoleate 10R-lipoxygenase